MSNYRRLISYIYAYEGGVKGKNVGFAKLETRNGQCRIQVSVRKIYVGSQDTGVYLLSGSSELLIGKIFLRNGCGEFRTTVPMEHVAGTDQTVDQCYGLTIHSLDDSWQSYTTIWEDAVAHAAEVELSEAVSEVLEEQEMNQIPDSNISPRQLETAVKNHRSSIAESIEEEIQAQEKLDEVRRQEEKIMREKIREEWQRKESIQAEMTREKTEMEVSVQPEMEAPAQPEVISERPEKEAVVSAETVQESRDEKVEVQAETVQESGEMKAPVQEEAVQESPDGKAEVQAETVQEEPMLSTVVQPRKIEEQHLPWPREEQATAQSAQSQSQPRTPAPQSAQDQPQLQISAPQTASKHPQSRSAAPATNWEQQQDRLDMLGAEEPDDGVEMGKLWNYFNRTYPKIQAFDYSGGCEILTIKPQDIGLLPREVWTYGNNSFLLHGYYNHRYLILARLTSPEGTARFLLGVPGHYYSSEKYMASMFGFPNFVLSKMQPSGDDRFGYWYTDIRIGNGN